MSAPEIDTKQAGLARHAYAAFRHSLLCDQAKSAMAPPEWEALAMWPSHRELREAWMAVGAAIESLLHADAGGAPATDTDTLTTLRNEAQRIARTPVEGLLYAKVCLNVVASPNGGLREDYFATAHTRWDEPASTQMQFGTDLPQVVDAVIGALTAGGELQKLRLKQLQKEAEELGMELTPRKAGAK